MVILGIDPGIATVGFGVIRAEGSAQQVVRYGAVTTPAGIRLSARLRQIHGDVCELIDTFKPDAIAIEQLFFNTNITTGIAVAHGRGVILLACQKAGIRIYEYTPLQVKQAVVGYGRAEKKQVMEMVKRICRLNAPPRPDDAADAVALALCHARSSTSLLYREEREDCSTI